MESGFPKYSSPSHIALGAKNRQKHNSTHEKNKRELAGRMNNICSESPQNIFLELLSTKKCFFYILYNHCFVYL